MKITLVVDNLSNGNLIGEHGLSILVETSDKSVLFDTGQTSVTVDNLKSLEIDMAKIHAIAISHGHYDHTGGLREVMSLSYNSKCYAHPDSFKSKYVQSECGLRYIGIPASSVISDKVIKYNRAPVEILDNIILSGEIPILSGMSVLDPKFLVEEEGNLHQDTFEDEQCMIIKYGSDTAVLLGCSHRGVENNIEAAMKIANVDSLNYVVGGMHLRDADYDRLDQVVNYFRNKQIKKIACCHCTGRRSFEYLKENLGDRVTLAHAGMCWEI